MGIWGCLDHNHDLFFLLHGLPLGRHKKHQITWRTFRIAVDSKRLLESGILLFKRSELWLSPHFCTHHFGWILPVLLLVRLEAEIALNCSLPHLAHDSNFLERLYPD